MADLRGRSMIEVADGGVKTANAAEARGEGNLTHRQASFINEFLGEVEPAGLGDGERGGSQMSQEQSAKMSRPNSYSFCEAFNPLIPEAALTDQAQSSDATAR